MSTVLGLGMLLLLLLLVVGMLGLVVEVPELVLMLVLRFEIGGW